ncbi:MAG TPA: outer membrane protein assembly factor BamC [Noviherbaspirillum sp.]
MHPFSPARGFLIALSLGALAGCGSFNSMMEGDRIDYKSAGKGRTLEVPPDLTQLQRENRYSVPKANVATASSYALQQETRPSAIKTVAPKAADNMRIERAGDQRWLVIKDVPEELWPEIKQFWQDMGFLIHIESPEAGIIETDWAENRAKLPQDVIRNTLGKVLDSLYSTGERDKFRTRLERTGDGVTEVYISHRRLEEVFVGNQEDRTIWTPKPADPELEAEFLARLMSHLGAQQAAAKAEVANAASQPARSKLVRNSNGGHVEVDESFERAWRRVGLALDRVGFTVEDRDRSAGVYFVRYVAPEVEQEPGKKGFFARMNPFSSSKDKARDAQRYRVQVKQTGEISRISVLDNNGQPESSKTGDRILSLLNEQLR